METEVFKYLVEYGVIGILAFYYIYDNRKKKKVDENREKANEEILQKVINKAFGSEEGGVVTLSSVLVNQLTDYESKNVKEHLELKNILKEIQEDMIDLFALYQKGESVTSKIKRNKATLRSKTAEALEQVGDDEKLKLFLFDFSNTFQVWLLDSMNYIFEKENRTDINYVFDNLKSNCLKMQKECIDSLGSDICSEFFDSRNIDVNKFIKDIDEIITDPGNDKLNRFFELSSVFLQKSLYKIIIVWSKNNNSNAIMKESEIDGLTELRRIEKMRKVELLNAV